MVRLFPGEWVSHKALSSSRCSSSSSSHSVYVELLRDGSLYRAHSSTPFFFSSLPIQKDEPPEITYCVVNQNGMLHLQPLSPSQPMPEESELDARFTELLVRIYTLTVHVIKMEDKEPTHVSCCETYLLA